MDHLLRAIHKGCWVKELHHSWEICNNSGAPHILFQSDHYDSIVNCDLDAIHLFVGQFAAKRNYWIVNRIPLLDQITQTEAICCDGFI